MRERKLWRYSALLLLAAAVAVSGAPVAFAQTAKSPNYQVTETEFGGMSGKVNCSQEYCARGSMGGMSGGASSSEGGGSARFSTVAAGSDDPLLEVIVDPGQSNLGVLETHKTSSKTAVVRVRTHLSSGYMLQIVGDPPKYGGHTLETPSAPTDSTPGTEQFGINAVANTVPAVGADPAQIPSGQTSFGVVNDNYNTPNKFMYSSGDVVAHSNSESGRTDYTISMIVNVSPQTPAGHYAGDFSAVIIPIY